MFSAELEQKVDHKVFISETFLGEGDWAWYDLFLSLLCFSSPLLLFPCSYTSLLQLWFEISLHNAEFPMEHKHQYFCLGDWFIRVRDSSSPITSVSFWTNRYLLIICIIFEFILHIPEHWHDFDKPWKNMSMLCVSVKLCLYDVLNVVQCVKFSMWVVQ